MSSQRYRFDRLILWYLAGVFAITFLGSYVSVVYLLAALGHLALIFLVLQLSRSSSPWGIRAWLRWFYPLLLMVPLHYEIEFVSTLLHGGSSFDDLVRSWDRRLFAGHPHRYLADWLSGPWWRELFHLLYVSYFAIVGGGFWVAWRRGKVRGQTGGWTGSSYYFRYVFVFVGSFLTYMAIFIVFPVVGPLDDRFLRFQGIGLLGPLVDLIYALVDSAGGAMPSSHVGESVVVLLLLRPRGLWVRAGLLALISGLAVSTVYGAFHYGIDALAGLATGPLFYLLWSWLYQRWGRESTDGS